VPLAKVQVVQGRRDEHEQYARLEPHVAARAARVQNDHHQLSRRMSNPTFELTPELRAAITQVFNDGSQNWDRGEGWPPNDPEVKDQYDAVKKLTRYADDQD
jgi:hypothetical protein